MPRELWGMKEVHAKNHCAGPEAARFLLKEKKCPISYGWFWSSLPATSLSRLNFGLGVCLFHGMVQRCFPAHNLVF